MAAELPEKLLEELPEDRYSDESGSDWEEVEEEEEEGGTPCRCLFCSDEFTGGALAALEHCFHVHGLQLQELVTRLGLDFYSRIKLINYIRKEKPLVSTVLGAIKPFPWEPGHYLTPAIPDDPLLHWDFEEEESMEQSTISTTVDSTESTESSSSSGASSLKAKRKNLKASILAYEASCNKLDEANGMVSQFQNALSQARQDLDSMRKVVQNLVGEMEEEKKVEHGQPKVGNEDGYFSSYTHFKIHEEMLKDEVRTETYKLFFEKNSDLFKDKVVLDIGCGTGILSLFAATAGAKQVIGVDQSDIVYKAMDIIRENGFVSRVILLKGRVEEVTLPVDKVDIIVSEWMGYFLLYESMLDTVLYARDKWLKNKSNLFPNSCSISIVALGNQFEWESSVQYWNNVYGFKMSCMKEDVLKEPAIQVVDHHSTISSTDTILKLDLTTVTTHDLKFKAPFSLTMQHDTECHALVGYFDVGFDHVKYPHHLSTGPQQPPTHWKQTVFHLREPIHVKTGDLMKGILSCQKSLENPRALDISIQFEMQSFHLHHKNHTIKVLQTFTLQ